MKKLLIILGVLVCGFSKAQENLIYHTSFEINPNNYCSHDQRLGFDSTRLENFYPDIFTSLNSVDIFSPCSSFEINGFPEDYYNGIPDNLIGFQYPFEYNNYIGLIISTDTLYQPQSKNYREWVGINPHYNFIKDKLYKVILYISGADTAGLYSIPPQVYFSPDSIFYESQTFNTDFSIIENANLSITDSINLYSDTVNWVQVNTVYKSNGNEKFIYLGNFLDSKHTKWGFRSDYIAQFSKPFSYFYIDDLSIFELDSTISVDENVIKQINIYPNPAQDFVSIDIPKNYTQAQLSIYNLTGQLVATKPIQSNQNIPVTELGNGMYIFVVQTGDKIWRERVVVRD